MNFEYHYNQLTQTDKVLPKCYGQPKAFKKDVTMRPIISLINNSTYLLAKLLYNDLKMNIQSPKSHLKNSLNLISKLNNLNIPDNCALMSLGVTSLFINLPLKLVAESL